MGSERIALALTRLETALARIESLPPPIPVPSSTLTDPEPSPADIALRVQAQETLQRLDSIIAELKDITGG